MDDNIHGRVMESEATLIQNLVERMPCVCACFAPVFDADSHIHDFIIINVNAKFEAMIELEKNGLIGKSVSETFGIISALVLRTLVSRLDKAYRTQEKTCEMKARVFHTIYKVSFLFISDTRLLILFEDIHAKYFRKHYQRSIPRDVIQQSFKKSRLFVPGNDRTEDERSPEPNAGFQEIFVENFQPLEIINDTAETWEPHDAVFRDSLTGLYNRVFAAEALRFYVDSKVLPLAVVLGDINGLKAYNESLGFKAGDELLIRVARVLQDNSRSDDVVTRWHDGQYLLLLPRATQAEAQLIIKRLQAKLNAICNDAYNLVTFGYASSENECRTAEDLIAEAEKWVNQKKLLINQSHRSSVIRLLLSMLREKSAETQEHSGRMADHCRWIAKRISLPDERIDDLVLLSMLHDIGKIGIPDSILNKPAALTDAERMIINQHPEIGYRIAQSVPELRRVADCILAHHERWDGTGYPNGLKGEAIPIASRIIAIVDAFDVMITGRKYKAARTKQEAIDELKRCAGTQFDPHLVAEYEKLLISEP